MNKRYSIPTKSFIPYGIVIFLLMSTANLFAQNLQISGGNSFSAAVCDNQQVFVWGANTAAQLGIVDIAGTPESATYVNLPQSVLYGNTSNVAGATTYGLLPAISQVDAGSGAHVMGLSCAKQVWTWGNGINGQLGRGSLVNSPVPQRVLRGAQAANVNANDPNGIFLNNIFYVSGGNNSSFALETGTGKVLAWGENSNGQLGDGTAVDKTTPVYVLTAAGVPLTNITQIEGGDACTYALDKAGNVWSWGLNTGNQLGRPGASPQVYAARVVQGDPNNNGYSATPVPTVYLDNIIQISGGDTHCLALDASGNVWSFGGDWGSGQLGRSGGSVYQDDARKVSIPGIATYATTNAQFLGNGVDGKAVYVSAGQSMSAVVMANGKVVTFGSRGLYNGGATDQASGSIITCPGTGDMIPSGALGDNNTTMCNSTTCSGKASATQWSATPVYVKTAGGVDLTGITQVTDGDAWFYAISSAGAAYTWGWNRRGELGLGDYNDRCAAVPFTLPAGCAFSNPCPGQPNLGADVTTCPVFSTTLNSNVSQTYTSYKYVWEYRAGTSGAWTALTALAPTGSNLVNYNPADKLGQYRVSIFDNRGVVPFLCAPCPTLMDTITFSPYPNPYTVTGCHDDVHSLAEFKVTAPASATAIKWYKNYADLPGTELNPLNTNTSIVVPYSSTNTSIPGCNHALFADDVTSFPGVLMPGTTVATAPCAGAGNSETGDRAPLKIVVTQNMQFTGLNFLQATGKSGTYVIRIYSDDPTAGYNCGSCTPSNSKSGNPLALLHTSTGVTFNNSSGSTVVRTLTDNYALTGTTASPTTYWIYVFGGEVINFNCTPTVNQTGVPQAIWSSPYVSSPAGMKSVLAYHDSSPTGTGNVFNLTFNVGTAYNCNKILVCADAGTCVLPVTLLNLYANRDVVNNYNLITWSTSSEKNNARFEVQRSTDGTTFTTIGTVAGNGNSSSIINYSYKDYSNLSGLVYYRLVQFDYDGKQSLSETKVVAMEGDEVQAKLLLYPNPNKGSFTVAVSGVSGDIYVNVNSTVGQPVYSTTTTSEGSVEKLIDLSGIAKGVYFVTVTTDLKSWTEKIVIE